MRPRQAVLLALLVALAGCSVGFGEQTPTATETPTATPVGDPSTTPDATTTPEQVTVPPDPETDVLGWENGYWANETLTLDRSDGLNETEVDAVVARAMARVETVRQLEFEGDVPVNLISREEFQNSSAAGADRDYAAAFRTFDNAKFEAMFLVGEEENSLTVQQSNRGSSVAGYYSPSRDEIVVIYPGDTPDLPGEGTLSHELTHALQDQQFGLGNSTAATRDGHNARNGLIEGEANLVQGRYMANCGNGWTCLPAPDSDGAGGSDDFHLGIYILNFFPYSDGPGFVAFYQNRGGWDRVDEMYDRVPASTEQVIDPRKYAVDRDEPVRVSLSDSTSNGWERVRPPNRANYATLGQSGMTAMFAYTLYDEYERDGVINPDEFLNRENGEVNQSDPFNYDIKATSGWDGDRMHVYTKDGETAYVWKTVWDSPTDAKEFAAGYRDLLGHWGATRVESGVYRADSGPFADSFRLVVDGNTVTIVNAPETSDLGDVYAG